MVSKSMATYERTKEASSYFFPEIFLEELEHNCEFSI